MKKSKILFILVVLVLNNLTAQENQEADLGKVEYYFYNEITSAVDINDMSVIYINNEIEVYFNDHLNTYSVVYDTNQLSSLQNALYKYLKWEKIATSNNETLEKDISDIEELEGYFNLLDEWYDAGTRNVITTSFFSQSPKRHQLVILYNKFVSTKNEFIEYTPPTMYFDKKDVEKFLYLISKENIEAKLKEAEEEKSKQDKYQ